MTTGNNLLVTVDNCPGEYYDDEMQLLWAMLTKDVYHTVFVVEAANVGWRNMSGIAVISPDSPGELLDGITGFKRAPCYHLEVYEKNNGHYNAGLYHHDSPTGESRMIHPVTEWIKDELAGVKLQTLHKFLSSFREEVGARYITTDADVCYDDEDATGKKARYYKLDDFYFVIAQYHSWETIADSDLIDIRKFVLSHAGVHCGEQR